MRQDNFFEREQKPTDAETEQLALYALGDFQARGKILAERSLPLDRLRGAFRRAAEKFGVHELADEPLVAVLNSLGAQVRRVPTFVAKHPFRIIVPPTLAERARQVYEESRARVE